MPIRRERAIQKEQSVAAAVESVSILELQKARLRINSDVRLRTVPLLGAVHVAHAMKTIEHHNRLLRGGGVQDDLCRHAFCLRTRRFRSSLRRAFSLFRQPRFEFDATLGCSGWRGPASRGAQLESKQISNAKPRRAHWKARS
eukprot:1552640-Pleurochrysis_carterae.AAC.9